MTSYTWSGKRGVFFGRKENRSSFEYAIKNDTNDPIQFTVTFKGSGITFPNKGSRSVSVRVNQHTTRELGVLVEFRPGKAYSLGWETRWQTAHALTPKDPFEDGRWIDPNFPPTSDSLGRRVASVERWVRATDIGDPGTNIFEGIESTDIIQGGLGDCWLLAGLSALAKFPKAIEDVFVQKTVQRSGKYCFNLYDVGKQEWELIEIDDLIPCRSMHGRWSPVFAQNNGLEIWVLLLEKAFAKKLGSYCALVSGTEAFALRTLVGPSDDMYQLHAKKRSFGSSWYKSVASKMKSNEKVVTFRHAVPAPVIKPEQIWQMLTNADANHFVMCCNFHTDTLGLERNHAFSLLKVYDIAGFKLLKIRNPWGNDKEWRGDWSDQSDLWWQNPRVKAITGATKADDGIFFMSFEDFGKYAESVLILPKSMTSTWQSRKRVRDAVDDETPAKFSRWHEKDHDKDASDRGTGSWWKKTFDTISSWRWW
jgi:hypothetical protein